MYVPLEDIRQIEVKEGNEERNFLVMCASCASRFLLMQVEADTPRLLDIVSILDRVPTNIDCDLPFLAYPFARPFSILLYAT